MRPEPPNSLAAVTDGGGGVGMPRAISADMGRHRTLGVDQLRYAYQVVLNSFKSQAGATPWDVFTEVSCRKSMAVLSSPAVRSVMNKPLE